MCWRLHGELGLLLGSALVIASLAGCSWTQICPSRRTWTEAIPLPAGAPPDRGLEILEREAHWLYEPDGPLVSDDHGAWEALAANRLARGVPWPERPWVLLPVADLHMLLADRLEWRAWARALREAGLWQVPNGN